jgi:four helix bundle protein
MRFTISPEQLEWERTCHPALTSDVIWKLDAYRCALFLLELAHNDFAGLARGPMSKAVADQLLYAVASISANIGEGFSRPTRADRLRFLGYALGSVRESVSWYLAVRGSIESATFDARLALAAHVRALLIGLIRSVRAKASGAKRFEP